MKAASPLASRTLLIAGLVLILSALVDYFVLLIPPDFSNRAQQVNLASQLVDRGIVPLVGITFLLLGGWIQTEVEGGRKGGITNAARLGSMGLAGLLSLLFLMIVPLHFNNVRVQKNTSLEGINEQATRAQGELSQAVDNQLQQERNRIQALLQNEQLLQDAIASGQLQGEQVALLQQFQAQPDSVEAYLQEEAEKETERLSTEITTRKEQATQEANRGAWKASSRTVLSSLLLTIAYALLGWTGLKSS